MIEEIAVKDFQLIRVSTPYEWEAYHRIRREQVIEPNGVVYNPEHWTFTHPHHHHFVFLKEAKIIGVVQVELVDEKHAILRPIAIDAPYQSQGYGTILLQQIHHWVQNQGRTVIYVHAALRAVPFYTRAGYKPMSFKDLHGINGREHVDMGISFESPQETV